MAIIICISDFWHARTYLQIDKHSNNKTQQLQYKPWSRRHNSATDWQSTNHSSGELGLKLRRLHLVVDGITAFYLLRELQEFTALKQRIIENPALRQMQLLWLQLVPPKKEIIDYRWNHMLALTLWEKIEVDYLMCWLSTLGGGYSALGEQFARCAETAGKISLRQLAIGMRLGDPFLQARCKLYYSISLIQTGRLKMAKYIVREQYKFARTYREFDGRLIKMCKGIWMRIQYEYSLRIQNSARQKAIMLAGHKRL